MDVNGRTALLEEVSCKAGRLPCVMLPTIPLAWFGESFTRRKIGEAWSGDDRVANGSRDFVDD